MIKKAHSAIHKHYHRKYHGVYQHAKQLFVFDIILLLFALTMFGSGIWFYVWKPGVSDKVELKISLGENRIKSGDKVKISIDYTNHSKVTLTNGVVALRLPKGFIPDDNSPTNNAFDLGTLPPGVSGRVELTGILWTNVGEEEKLIATLSYKQETRSTEEKALGSYYVKLSDSVLSGTITVATSSFSGKNVPFSFAIQNSGTTKIENAVVSFSSPINKEVKEITLEPGERKQLEDSLHISNTDLVISAKPIVHINNSNLNQKPFEKTIKVFNSDIAIKAELAQNITYADTGMNVPVQISWKNDSSFKLKDQKIRLLVTPGILNYQATLSDNNIEKEGNDLLITPKSRTLLSNGDSGTQDNFTVNLKLANNFNNKSEEANSLSVKPVFESTATEVDGQMLSSIGSGITLPLASEVVLSSDVRYYTDEGDQLGRGPLPPAVGETTKYWVFVTVQNTTNQLEKGRLNVELAPGVTFTGRQSVTIGPELKYNSNTNVMSWVYNWYIPSYSESGFYFEVAVTPTPNMVGKNISLVKSITFTAQDEKVLKNYKLNDGPLTNVLGESDRGSELGAEVVTN